MSEPQGPISVPRRENADIHGVTHPGLVRKENQDHFLIATIHKVLQVFQTSVPAETLGSLTSPSRGFVFLVADGVGGGPGGKEASRTALKGVVDYVVKAMDLYVQIDPAVELETMEFVQQAERLWAQAEKLAEGDRDLSYRVRMAGIPVLWAKLKLLGGPEQIYQVEDGRLVHRQVDPAYRKAGQEQLRRVAEGHVRVREYTGYHQQEIMDLTGHVEGHKLVEASAGGATVATAPGCGGSAVVWSQQGKSNLLSPAGGGVEIVNRHRNLERPDFTEFELVSNESGRIALRAARQCIPRPSRISGWPG